MGTPRWDSFQVFNSFSFQLRVDTDIPRDFFFNHKTCWKRNASGKKIRFPIARTFTRWKVGELKPFWQLLPPSLGILKRVKSGNRSEERRKLRTFLVIISQLKSWKTISSFTYFKGGNLSRLTLAFALLPGKKSNFTPEMDENWPKAKDTCYLLDNCQFFE